MKKKEGEMTAAEAIAELRKKKRGRLTAAEVMAVLEKNPEYVARRAQQEKDLEERVRAWRKEEQPLIQALRDVGENVETVWDLVNTTRAYPKAIPILFEHLQKPYHPKIKEGIARALTVRAARGVAWSVLLSEFLKDHDRSTLGPKWAIANALSFIADKNNVDDILELVQDKRHGENRGILVDALARFADSGVVRVLSQLTQDKEVAPRAEKALRKIEKRKKR